MKKHIYYSCVILLFVFQLLKAQNSTTNQKLKRMEVCGIGYTFQGLNYRNFRYSAGELATIKLNNFIIGTSIWRGCFNYRTYDEGVTIEFEGEERIYYEVGSFAADFLTLDIYKRLYSGNRITLDAFSRVAYLSFGQDNYGKGGGGTYTTITSGQNTNGTITYYYQDHSIEGSAKGDLGDWKYTPNAEIGILITGPTNKWDWYFSGLEIGYVLAGKNHALYYSPTKFFVNLKLALGVIYENKAP